MFQPRLNLTYFFIRSCPTLSPFFLMNDIIFSVSMGQRKGKLARRPFRRRRGDRSLHADGVAGHKRGRLRDRQWWWSPIQHSGLPLQPAGQHHWAEALLGEHHSCHGKYPPITLCQDRRRSCSKRWYSE
jgi:hypothetical protein